MDLLEYIVNNNENIKSFCKRAGIERTTFYRVLKGLPVRMATCLKIKKATGGVINLSANVKKEATNTKNKKNN